MRNLAIQVLCLALVAGLASAQQQNQNPVRKKPSSATASPRPSVPSHSQGASPRPITAEEVFFYSAAIFGVGGDLAKIYAIKFDTTNYNQAMANEFSRAQYMERMKSKVEAELKRVDFSRQFTMTGGEILFEYSFANHYFPMGGDQVIRNFRIEAFDGTAVNVRDFNWILPMSETEANSFVKSRTVAGGRIDRSVGTRITYSIVDKKGRLAGVFGAPPSFNIYIHSVEVYSDGSLTKKLGTLKKRPGIPESSYAPDVLKAATSPTKTISTYKYAPAGVLNVHGTLRPQIAGTITVTDVGVTLSGEQGDGSVRPGGVSYLDSFATENVQHRHDVNVMRLLRSDYAWPTGGGADYRVIWDVFSNYPHDTPLVFDSRAERDRFFIDLVKALQDWAANYPQFAETRLDIDMRCENAGGSGYVGTCPGESPWSLPRAELEALESSGCTEGEQQVPGHSKVVFVLSNSRECWTPWLVLQGSDLSDSESGNVLVQYAFRDGTIGDEFVDGPNLVFHTTKPIQKIRFKSLRKEPVTITLDAK
jgi:hypothetical protein